MKTKIITISIYIILSLILGLLFNHSKKIKQDRDRLLANQEVLLSENEYYETEIGTHAAKTSALQFSLSEYKKYRSDDLKIIEQLKLDKKGLQSVISTDMQTITSLKIALKDSSRIDTITKLETVVRYFDYKSEWIDIKGYVDDSLNLEQIVNRERLKLATHKVPKKFIFIKLPISIFGYKDMQIDVTSLNPNTKIDKVEFITIK